METRPVTDLVAIEDRWREGMKQSALRYQQEDRAGYVAILHEISSRYAGQLHGYKRTMQAVQYQCALAHGWPTMEQYKQHALTQVES